MPNKTWETFKKREKKGGKKGAKKDWEKKKKGRGEQKN